MQDLNMTSHSYLKATPCFASASVNTTQVTTMSALSPQKIQKSPAGDETLENIVGALQQKDTVNHQQQHVEIQSNARASTIADVVQQNADVLQQNESGSSNHEEIHAQ